MGTTSITADDDISVPGDGRKTGPTLDLAAGDDTAATCSAHYTPTADPFESDTLSAGVRVGRYHVIDLLGAGGLGIVYRAYDAELDRAVAVKLLRELGGGSSSTDTQRRFVREAQALAKLAHPNVIAVHDVGTHGDEIFIAMELVEGRSLKEWLREHRPGWREVLSVFAQAGRGLAAAHAVGLVHRDFKPANAILGNDGRVRVLDFGLARASSAPEVSDVAADPSISPGVAESSNALSQELTCTGSLVGTPAYMSPEQLTGAEVGAAADQFSFCVALYEALYGKRPFLGKTAAERERAIAAGPDDAQLRDADAPRWLGPIVIRGLAATAEQRHPSMRSLLAALADDPAARRRRRLLAVAGIALMVAAVGVGSLLAGRKPTVCRGGPDRSASVWNGEVEAEVTRSLRASGLAHAGDTARRSAELASGYVAAWNLAYREACEATHILGEQSAAKLDLRMTCMSGQLDELGALLTVMRGERGADSVDHAVRAFSRLPLPSACAETERLAAGAPLPADPIRRAAVASLTDRVNAGEALYRLGQYRAAFDVLEPLVDEARNLDFASLTGRALVRMVSVGMRLGAVRESELRLQEALRASAASRDDHLLGTAWVLLAHHYAIAGRLDEAALAARAIETLAVRTASRRLRIEGLVAEATFLRIRGDHELAHARAHEAVALMEAERGESSLAVARPLALLAAITRRLGRLEEAGALHERVLQIRERTLGPEHPDIADSLLRLSWGHTDRGAPREAEKVARRALAIYESVAGGGDSVPRARARFVLAHALHEAGEIATAIEYYDMALATYLRLSPKHPNIGGILNRLSDARLIAGQLGPARASFERARAFRAEIEGPGGVGAAQALANFGAVDLAAGRYAAADDKCRRALAAMEARLGDEHPDLADPLGCLGEALLERGAPARALPHLERAAELGFSGMRAARRVDFNLARALGNSDPARGRKLAERAAASWASGGPAWAVQAARARDWLEQHGGPR